jgi:hypothetical protein
MMYVMFDFGNVWNFETLESSGNVWQVQTLMYVCLSLKN